eukprot:TRINITY_DN29_c0_g2_i1.p1 TRINITY_DN29_c0_g2~~TRINITY_DN29_c0_g2_i1.p1  ORF type:complete len:570 (+),score=208.29 TRINITY_DN29_c0_g2_i1:199-1908(+)
MGAGLSSPVDADTKREIEECIKAILTTFTTEYVKWTAIYMVKDAQAKAKKEKPKNKLMHRPEDSLTEPLKTGWIMKEGGIRKSWKKRFMIARPNYTVDYYEKEEDAKNEKKKPKGTMGLCGYHVVDDPNDGVIKKLKNLAEKMKIDLSELPKPKEYPPFTLELNHWRRRSYFITAPNEEEFKGWCDVMRQVCWRAYGFKNRDKVHIKAFGEAVKRTRWELGRWGWWSFGGSEEQILTDLISDQLEWAVMGKIYSKISSGPWVVRNKIRKQVLKTLDATIGAAVKPAWAAMEKAVEELKPKVEPALTELGTQIGEVEAKLQKEITDAVMSILNPLLAEHVTPHLGNIFAVIREPMKEAFDEAFTIFNKSIDKAEIKGTADEMKKGAFRELDYVPRSWAIWDATRKLDPMYEPLWALNVVFKDIYPWWSIWRGQDNVRNVTDDAIYTFEQKLLENEASAAENKDKIKAEVMADFQHDATLTALQWYAVVFKKIIMPPLRAVVNPAVKEILSPIHEAVPGPVKQFINVHKMFAEILNKLVDEIIMSILKGANESANKAEAIEAPHHKEEITV